MSSMNFIILGCGSSKMNITTKVCQNIGQALARPVPPALESGEVAQFLPRTADHNSGTVLNKLH